MTCVVIVIYLGQAISTSMAMRGKDKEIKKNKDEVWELAKRVHQLELENERIKNGSPVEPSDPNSL